MGTVKLTIVLVVLASLAQAVEYVEPRRDSQVPDPYTAANRNPMFRITGHVIGLFPGRQRMMRTVVANPNRVPIVVTRVRATVSSEDPGCAAKNVKVTPWRGSARIAAHAHRRFKLVVRMMRRTPDACQGERFWLRFGGAAVRP